MKISTALIHTLLIGAAGASFAAEPPAYDIKTLTRTDELSLRPENAQYPAELHKAGVQGTVLVIVPLTAEGKSDGALLGESSLSEKLDQAALDLVKGYKFSLKDAPAKGWKAVIVPVEFYKDSATTLGSKTCADFNLDLAYFQATRPTEKIGSMRVFNMSTGMLYLSGAVKPAQGIEFAKSVVKSVQPTIDACKTSPDALFYATYAKVVKSGM
jgi:TonB family protein